MFVLHARLIRLYPLNSHDTFARGQEPRIGRAIGEEEQVERRGGERAETEDDHEPLTGVEGTRVDVLHAECEKTVDALRRAVHEEPVAYADRLFVQAIELRLSSGARMKRKGSVSRVNQGFQPAQISKPRNSQ